MRKNEKLGTLVDSNCKMEMDPTCLARCAEWVSKAASLETL